MKLNIAIAGATGNVGRKIIEVLERRKFPLNNLYLLASKNSSGKEIDFLGKKIIVEQLDTFDFSKATITFFLLRIDSYKSSSRKSSSRYNYY